MTQHGWILAAVLAMAAVPAAAQSTGGVSGAAATGASGLASAATGFQGAPSTERTDLAIRTFRRTINGRQVRETYALIERFDDRRGRGTGKRYPRCRTGLFGRVVNKPCRPPTRSGGIFKGRRY